MPFDSSLDSVLYFGENKYGRCAEVFHDLVQCQRNAIDHSVECRLLQEDYDECTNRKKQKAALQKIQNSMQIKKSFRERVKMFLLMW